MSTALQNKASHLQPYHFKPGQSGNPNGRGNRKYSIIDQVKTELATVTKDKTLAQVVARRLLGIITNKKTAPSTVIACCALLFQYTEQKPVQKVELADGKRQAYLDVYNWFATFRGEDGSKEPMPKDMCLAGLLRIHPDAKECVPELWDDEAHG